MFRYSRDRTGEHPQRHLAGYARILQADAYAGFNELYLPGRKAVAHLRAEHAVSERLACQVLGAERSVVRSRGRRGDDASVRERLRALAS